MKSRIDLSISEKRPRMSFTDNVLDDLLRIELLVSAGLLEFLRVGLFEFLRVLRTTDCFLDLDETILSTS